MRNNKKYTVRVGSIHRQIGGTVLKIIDADIHPNFKPNSNQNTCNIGLLLVSRVSHKKLFYVY